MFAYCGNNPVSRNDIDGEAFDTIFDIWSLCSSILDVVVDPYDPWAWVGLAGDVVDVVVPFVSGTGELARAAKVAKETAEKVDDARDAAKALNRYPGRHGGADHREIIEKLQDAFKNNNISTSEHRVDIPGTGKYRYPDLTLKLGDADVYIQVGRQTKGGLPVAREAKAMADLALTGNWVIFIPYNKIN